jgi:hypothetical protein
MPPGPLRRLVSPRLLRPLLLAVGLLAAGSPVLALDISRPSPLALPTADEPRRLPADLEPSLDDASRIRPRAYEGGCHAEKGDRTPELCQFGVEDGAFSVVLLGDSHALQWLPALEVIAESQGWRLYSMTKSACPVPDTPVIVRGERPRDCPPWRSATFRMIEELHPDLVIAASLGRIYEIPRAETPARHWREWRAGWTRSLERLRAASGRVVLLGDTPMWQEDPVACLRRHRRDIGRCDTPRREAISTRTETAEREAAEAAGVRWVPTADLVCPRDPCRAVEGRYLVLRDIQHLTVAWARMIGPALLERLTCGVAPEPSPGVAAASLAPASVAPSASPPTASVVPSPEVSVVPSAVPSAPLPSPGSSPGLSC